MLSEAVNRHIELYRSMGFKYKVQAYMLHSFADFAQSRSEQFIRTDTVLEWAASAPSVRQRHDRLLTIFAARPSVHPNTMNYLRIHQNLVEAVNDRLGLAE